MAREDAVIRLGIEVGEVKKGLDVVQKELKDTQASIKKTARAGKNLESGFMSVGVSADGLKGAFGSVSRAMGVAGAAASALGVGLVAVTASAFETTAKSEALRKGLENLAGDSGRAAAALEAVMSATNGTVSEMEAMRIANTAMSFGIVENAAQLEEMATIGVTLGRSLGIDAAKSVEDLTTALARQSPMILDNLGITLKLEEAYDIYAKSLGKSADALTEAEKQQAFLNAALIKGREKVEEMGGRVETAGDAYLRLKARVSDAKVAFAEALANSEGLGESIDNLASGIEGLVPKLVDAAERLAPLAAGLVDFADGLLDAFFAIDQVDKANLNALDAELLSAREEVKSLASDVRIAEQALQFLESATGASRRALESQGYTVEEARQKLQELQGALGASATKLGELEAKRKGVNLSDLQKDADAATKAFGGGGGGGGGGDGLAGAVDETKSAFQELVEGIAALGERAEDVEELNEETAEQLELMDTLVSGADSAKEALRQLWLDGKIGTDAYNTTLAQIIAQQDRLIEQRAEMESAGLAGLGLAEPEFDQSVAGPGEGDIRTGELRLPPGAGSLGAVGPEAGELEEAGFDLSAVMDPDFDFEGALERWNTVQMAVSDGTMMMAEAQDQLREAGLGVNGAIDTQLKSLQKQGKMAQDVAALNTMFGQAASQAGGMLIDMAIKGEFSAKKLLKATLDSISKQSKQKAMFEVAEGFAALAKKDGAGAALHFKSAAVFGALAIASGIAANAVGGGEEEGEGGRQDPSASGSTDRDTARTLEASEEADRVGPSVTVAIEGDGIIAGTTPEEFARAITPFVEAAVADAGGGNGLRGG